MARLLHRYLSFDGRLARLPFFARNIYVGLAAAVIAIASVPLFSTDTSVGYWGGVLVVVTSLSLLIVGSVSLIVRRLHDLGLSGYHAIWAGAAQAAWIVISHGPPGVVLLGLPLAAIGFWLLLWPGKKAANRFGEAAA
jgi:uncharacterized membrane protein YhaH (DUF805 family)